MKIDWWNHLGPAIRIIHNHQGCGAPYRFLRYQTNILNWRIKRGHEIGTDHTQMILTLSLPRTLQITLHLAQEEIDVKWTELVLNYESG